MDPAERSRENISARLSWCYGPRLIASRSSWATSNTSVVSGADPSACFAGSPSVSMIRQNGHPVAIASWPLLPAVASVPNASSVRFLVHPSAEPQLRPNPCAAGVRRRRHSRTIAPGSAASRRPWPPAVSRADRAADRRSRCAAGGMQTCCESFITPSRHLQSEA
jgi:hypothetical protein